LLTHPDEKDSGSAEGLKAYERVLEHLSSYKRFWAKGFAEQSVD